MATLGTRIKELRNRKGLNQEDLGKLFGIVKSTVSLYENDKSTPDDDIKKKMAKYFNVSLDFLMGESDVENPYKVDDKINEFTTGDVKGFIIREDGSKHPQVNEVEEAMKIILDQPGLMLKGEILSDESKIILANAIQMGLRTAEELEKKKSKGDKNE